MFAHLQGGTFQKSKKSKTGQGSLDQVENNNGLPRETSQSISTQKELGKY